jgi:hypothetical protein
MFYWVSLVVYWLSAGIGGPGRAAKCNWMSCGRRGQFRLNISRESHEMCSKNRCQFARYGTRRRPPSVFFFFRRRVGCSVSQWNRWVGAGAAGQESTWWAGGEVDSNTSAWQAYNPLLWARNKYSGSEKLYQALPIRHPTLQWLGSGEDDRSSIPGRGEEFSLLHRV